MSQHIFGEANMEVQLLVNRSFTGKVRDTHEHKRDSSVQPRHGGSLGTITWVQLPVGTGQRVGSDIYPETEQVRSLFVYCSGTHSRNAVSPTTIVTLFVQVL